MRPYRVTMLLALSLFLTCNCIEGQELVTGSHAKKFTPGDQLIYQDDFHLCPIGEVPREMDKVSGAVECVKYENHIWLAPSVRSTEDHEPAVYKDLDIGRHEFSIEFDVMALKQHAYLMLRLLKRKGKQWDQDRFPFDVHYDGISWDKYCDIKLEGVGSIARIRHDPKNKTHIAIQVRRGQFRVYVNGKRTVMKPFPKGDVSGLEFRFTADTDKYGILISNIRVAEYMNKEATPTPEELGMSVIKNQSGVTLRIPGTVLFDFNKFILKAKSKMALSVIASFIRQHPGKKVIVTGYTDNIGEDAYNLRLSLQRAQSVADYLMYVEKLPAEKFLIKGKGKADPVASNATEDGRAKNRRVEIDIVR